MEDLSVEELKNELSRLNRKQGKIIKQINSNKRRKDEGKHDKGEEWYVIAKSTIISTKKHADKIRAKLSQNHLEHERLIQDKKAEARKAQHKADSARDQIFIKAIRCYLVEQFGEAKAAVIFTQCGEMVNSIKGEG